MGGYYSNYGKGGNYDTTYVYDGGYKALETFYYHGNNGNISYSHALSGFSSLGTEATYTNTYAHAYNPDVTSYTETHLIENGNYGYVLSLYKTYNNTYGTTFINNDINGYLYSNYSMGGGEAFGGSSYGYYGSSYYGAGYGYYSSNYYGLGYYGYGYYGSSYYGAGYYGYYGSSYYGSGYYNYYGSGYYSSGYYGSSYAYYGSA